MISSTFAKPALNKLLFFWSSYRCKYFLVVQTYIQISESLLTVEKNFYSLSEVNPIAIYELKLLHKRKLSLGRCTEKMQNYQ